MGLFLLKCKVLNSVGFLYYYSFMDRLLLLMPSHIVNKPKATINSIANRLPKGNSSCVHCANNIVGCIC